jgi:hypothetical protein
MIGPSRWNGGLRPARGLFAQMLDSGPLSGFRQFGRFPSAHSREAHQRVPRGFLMGLSGRPSEVVSGRTEFMLLLALQGRDIVRAHDSRVAGNPPHHLLHSTADCGHGRRPGFGLPQDGRMC